MSYQPGYARYDKFALRFREESFARQLDSLPASPSFVQFRRSMEFCSAPLLRVMDCCCGTGKASVGLIDSPRVSELVLLDRCGPGLEIAQRKLSKRSAVVSVVQDSMEHATVAPSFFHFILMAYGIHMLEDPQTVLAKLAQALTPAGKLVFNLPGYNVYRLPTTVNFEGMEAFFRAFAFRTVEVLEEELGIHFGVAERAASLRWDQQILGHWDDAGVRSLLERLSPQFSLDLAIVEFDVPLADKFSYARLFGSPPLPWAWPILDDLSYERRSLLIERILANVEGDLAGTHSVRWAEPFYTITRNQ